MIVERHGGELTVAPAHPHGCIFRMVLPIAELAAVPEAEGKTTDGRSPSPSRARSIWRRFGSKQSAVDIGSEPAAGSQATTGSDSVSAY
jgi:hypothetical protein